MLAETFLHLLAPELVAGLLSGAVVLGLGYFFIDRRLRLGERADREQATERERGELRASALAIVETELISNASLLQVWREVLETTHRDLPTPGFDINGWYLVTQGYVLAALPPPTADLLMHVYNRMRSANSQLDLLADMTFGPSALRIAIALAGASDPHGELPGPVATLRDQFEQHHADRRSALVARLDNLKPLLDQAIDAVEQENGTYEGVPASQRHFLREEAPIRVGQANPVSAAE